MQTVEVPIEPTHEMLKALAGDPIILAASDEQELRTRYKAMLEVVIEKGWNVAKPQSREGKEG